MPNALLTGGAGYIGSHTAVELIEAGWRVVVVDNLCNSSAVAIDRVGEITGVKPELVVADIRDRDALDRIFATTPIDAVVHFAGLKAVGESVSEPLRYYRNNLEGTLTLIEAMRDHGVRRMVFSSSATVYSGSASMPLSESSPLGPSNPYGRTKAMIEDILRDVAATDPSWQMMLLRYFNPVGAHASGRIGEDPVGAPNNLMPFVAQVAVGRRPELSVFGDDYATPDGTGVRDYIHVVDLARGHLAALTRMFAPDAPQVATVNLGTGRGHSVLEVIRAFEAASGRTIRYRIVARRPGDLAECYATVDHARDLLGWSAERTLPTMCEDAWRWQSGNPEGYGGKG